MRKTRHRTGTARSTMAAVPAVGGVVGRQPAGRLVSGLIATTFSVVTAIGAVLAVVGAADAPSGIPTSWLLVHAGLGIVVAAAAWSVSPARRRVAAGMAVLLAGWLLPNWAGSLERWADVMVVFPAAAPLMVAGVATASLSWSERPPRAIRSALRGTWALVAAAIAVRFLGYDPFADPACKVVCRHASPLIEDWVSTRVAVQVAALLTVAAALV